MKNLFFTGLVLLSGNVAISQTIMNVRTTAITAQAAIVPDPPGPNSVNFDYDAVGNQTKRSLIYLSAKSSGNNSNPEITEAKFTESDIYKDVSYYPNPVVEILSVKWENENGFYVDNMQLYNLSGQMLRVFPDLKQNEIFEVDFQEYPSGLFELILVYSNGEQKTLKILKK